MSNSIWSKASLTPPPCPKDMGGIKKHFNVLKVQDQLQLSSSSNRRLEANLQLLRNQYINQLQVQKTMDVFNARIEPDSNDCIQLQPNFVNKDKRKSKLTRCVII